MENTEPWFESVLNDLRTSAVEGLAVAEKRLADASEVRVDTPADDEHDPEGSTMSFEWSMSSALRDDALRELDEIDDALLRIRAGSFGVCMRCGNPIPRARLAARPTATLCIGCAQLP